MGIIAAVIARRSIAEAFSTKMWFNTYGANPVAAAASRAVLRVLDEDNVLANCRFGLARLSPRIVVVVPTRLHAWRSVSVGFAVRRASASESG